MEQVKMREFDVQFEDVGFTGSDLSDRELTESEAKGFTETAVEEKTLPEGVVAVVRGYITEDDNQTGDEKKVFSCVILRVRAEDEEAAEAFVPPKAFLAKLADMMATDTDGNLDLELEGNWEVSVGSAELVDSAEARETISVTVHLDIYDPATFRAEAYARALKDGLDEEQAAEYLNPEKMSLGQCGIMLIDPGVSPDGAQIENSSAE